MSRTKPGYRIFAVDPGTRDVGVAVLVLGRGPKPEVLHHGVIRARRSAPVPERLREIYEALETLIDSLQPDVVVVEDIFHGKNVRSAFRIGEGRGVVLLAAARSGCDVVEYSPATVKQAVTGSGRASKSQVQSVICRLLDLQKEPASSDAADALAIALCHAQRLRGGLSGVPASRRGRRGNTLQALVDRLLNEPSGGKKRQ